MFTRNASIILALIALTLPIGAQERAEVKCKAEPILLVHNDEKPKNMWSAECTINVGEKQIFRKMFDPVLTIDEALAQIKQFIKKGQYKALKDAGY